MAGQVKTARAGCCGGRRVDSAKVGLAEGLAPLAPEIAAARLRVDLLHGTGKAVDMDADRERALTLAHEAEPKGSGGAPPEQVIERARWYLDFLRGTSDAEIIEAAIELKRRLDQSSSVA